MSERTLEFAPSKFDDGEIIFENTGNGEMRIVSQEITAWDVDGNSIDYDEVAIELNESQVRRLIDFFLDEYRIKKSD